MQMRHQPFVIGDYFQQIVIDLDGIDRRQPQPLQICDFAQNLPHQAAERRRAGKISAVAGEIDAGQHDLAMAARHQRAHLIDHRRRRQRARRAAAIRNDAEGAAVIAAILHRHEYPRQIARDPLKRHRRHGAHRHDIADRDFARGAIV